MKRTSRVATRRTPDSEVITPLASSSAGNALLVEDHGSRILIDAGLTFPVLQRALDFRTSTLAAALISHEHADHSRAARALLKAGVTVAATNGTIDALNLRPHHRLKEVAMFEPFEVPGFTVVAFPTIHDAAEPCGFLLTGASTKVAYLTDTAFSEYRFTGVTHVLIEANHSARILRRRLDDQSLDAVQYRRVVSNHLSVERAIELLLASDLSRCEQIWLLHLSGGNSDEREFRTLVERATGIPTFVAGKRDIT